MPQSFPETLDIVIGVLQLTLAFVVARRLVRFGREFPWLVALMVYFLVRGADRVYNGLDPNAGEDAVLFGDMILVGVLLLLIAGLNRTVRGLEVAQAQAEWREQEYQRALSDYRTLARHRLANPLAAIEGSTQTLLELDELDEATRRQLLEVIAREAKRLHTVALDPEATEPTERGLHPQPNLGDGEPPSA